MSEQYKGYNIDRSKNYKRISNGEVLSGNQIIYLLELANPMLQAIILLDIFETEEPVNNSLVKGHK